MSTLPPHLLRNPADDDRALVTTDRRQKLEPSIAPRGTVRFRIYATSAAMEADAAFVPTPDDIVLLPGGWMQVFVVWIVKRERLERRHYRRLIFDGLDAPDDDDVVRRYEAVLHDARVVAPIVVRLRPSNASVHRLLEPTNEAVRGALRRFDAITLSYARGALCAVYARFWRSTAAERAEMAHRLVERTVRVGDKGEASGRDALVRLCQFFTEVATPQASLTLLVDLIDRDRAFSRSSLSFLVGRSAPAPPHWHVETEIVHVGPGAPPPPGVAARPVNQAGPATVRAVGRYLVNLVGPAATRDALRTQLALLAGRARQNGDVVRFELLPTQLPPELAFRLPSFATADGVRALRATTPLALGQPLHTVARHLPGHMYRWSYQHGAMLRVVLALAPLGLPTYIVLWTLEWLDLPFIWRSTEVQRWRLVDGVFMSTRRVFEEREQRAATRRRMADGQK